jgi:hypothetical protein
MSGVVVVATIPLAYQSERFTAVECQCGEEPYRDRDVRVQVGPAVIADRGGPVAVDSREVMVEVPTPAAARAVIFDPLAQPMPLQRTGRRFGVQDQAGDLLPAAFVVGLVAASRTLPGAWPCSTWTGRPLAARSVPAGCIAGTPRSAAGGLDHPILGGEAHRRRSQHA